MRMPVAAQRASMPVFLCADGDFSTGMVSRPSNAGRGSFATARTLRQVTPHQKGIQLLPAGLLIIAFPPADDLKSGPFIQAPRRLIIFFDLEEHLAHAAARVGRFDRSRAAAPPFGEPCHRDDAGGCEAPDSGSFGGLASGARR